MVKYADGVYGSCLCIPNDAERLEKYNYRRGTSELYAGILLGEDSAFQADEAGSNPTTRSRF